MSGRLESYRRLVLKWNKSVPLVSRQTPELSLDRLLSHALEAEKVLPTNIRLLIDVGSGCGLPGIPMAVKRPGMHVLLVERRLKKQMFLREAVYSLGLDNAEVFAGDFSVELIRDERPLALTSIGVGNYVDLAAEVWGSLKPGDGFCLFISKSLAEEIAGVVGSRDWSWKPLEGSRNTGVAWIMV